MDDLLIIFGGEVKALPGDGRRFGGYLALHSGPDDPDLVGDYFTEATDFDFEDGDRRSGYLKHAGDRIARGTLTRDTKGVLLEALLDERYEYADDVWQAVEAGALGLSSGAIGHLVRRERVESKSGQPANFVRRWPIGEFSATPRPAEPRTLALPIKEFLKSIGEPAEPPRSLALDTDTVIRTATDLITVYRDLATKEGRALSTARRTRLQTWREAMSALLGELDGLLTETEPAPKQSAEDAPRDVAAPKSLTPEQVAALAEFYRVGLYAHGA
jgi:hypothetical protein